MSAAIRRVAYACGYVRGFAKGFIAGLRHRVQDADARLARLADPGRCPGCGHELAAHEDVFTPHDCPEEAR